MAKLIKGKTPKKVKPKEKTFLVILKQSEADMVGGIIHDLLDNPERKVSMRYSVDGTDVVPTKKGYKALKSSWKAFSKIEEAADYWYDDLWEDVTDS